MTRPKGLKALLKKKRCYTTEQMRQAIAAASAGQSLASTAKEYGVPRATLTNKITGNSPLECVRPGPKTILTVGEENLLEQWVLSMRAKHMTVTKEQLLDCVQKIVTIKGIRTPFVNDRPGNKWYVLFLRRHPLLIENIAHNRRPKNIVRVTEKCIEDLYTKLKDYLKTMELKTEIEECENVFNTEKRTSYLSPKTGQVFVKSDDEHQNPLPVEETDDHYDFESGNAEEWLSDVEGYDTFPDSEQLNESTSDNRNRKEFVQQQEHIAIDESSEICNYNQPSTSNNPGFKELAIEHENVRVPPNLCTDCLSEIDSDKRNQSYGNLIMSELQYLPACMRSEAFINTMKYFEMLKRKHKKKISGASAQSQPDTSAAKTNECILLDSIEDPLS